MLSLQDRMDLGVMAMKGYSIFPKPHDWSLTIKWFKVISRTLVVAGSYSSANMQCVYYIAQADWAQHIRSAHCRKWIQWPGMSRSTNTLGKGMNPAILPPAIVEQTRLFTLHMATSLGEGKLWIQSNFTLLKTWHIVSILLVQRV